MAVQHTNRRGQTYYLHRGADRAGKPTYYFSLSSEGDLVDTVPAGYEVYESPRGQVFLRRVRRQVITPAEVAEVERALGRYPRLEYSRVDVRGRTITVFIPNQEAQDDLADLLREAAGGRDIGVAEIVARSRHLSADFRLVLVDEEQRTFQPQRFCYLGSINDWIRIGDPGPLPELLDEYVNYLGTESWFDLC